MDYLDFPAGTKRIKIKYHFDQIALRIASNNKKDQSLKCTFFMKLHLKQQKRYIAENNYFFRTSGDMWFDVMNQYEGIGKVLFMTRLFKIYSIHIDFVIKLNVG